MKKLQIMIMPSFNTTRESMGIEEYEDYNPDSVLFQQGYDADVIEVEDNEVFKIEDGYIGRILDDEIDDELDEELDEDIDKDIETEETELYLISDLEDLEEKYEYLLEGDLEEGRYKFLAKHNAILSL